MEKQIGALAEAKVTADLIDLGWEVLLPISSQCPFDLVCYKESMGLIRVQVKGSARPVDHNANYTFKLATSYARKSDKPFNKDMCDILALYMVEDDKIFYLPTNSLKNTTSIRIGVSMTNGNTIKTALEEWPSGKAAPC